MLKAAPIRSKNSVVSAFAGAVIAALLLFTLILSGCSKPNVPSLTGSGMFHDIGQVRKNMSPNEVRRVMGTGYKTQMDEGIRGMDGGNYTWVYPEGKVFFGYDGVTGIEAN